MDSSGQKQQNTGDRPFAVIVLLAIACIAALWWFLTDLHQTYRIVRLHETIGSRAQHLTPSDIQPWMTFEYVNRVFKLPPEYLKARLSIKDRHYPRLQINHYANTNRLDVHQAIQSVRTAVEEYQSIKK